MCTLTICSLCEPDLPISLLAVAFISRLTFHIFHALLFFHILIFIFFRLIFVDLAGSERAVDGRPGSDRKSRMESAEINQNILAVSKKQICI